jgi:hypothetical protein
MRKSTGPFADSYVRSSTYESDARRPGREYLGGWQGTEARYQGDSRETQKMSRSAIAGRARAGQLAPDRAVPDPNSAPKPTICLRSPILANIIGFDLDAKMAA